VVQGVGPEFKPQYCKKKKKEDGILDESELKVVAWRGRGRQTLVFSENST
jgi:hypothetical protein